MFVRIQSLLDRSSTVGARTSRSRSSRRPTWATHSRLSWPSERRAKSARSRKLARSEFRYCFSYLKNGLQSVESFAYIRYLLKPGYFIYKAEYALDLLYMLCDCLEKQVQKGIPRIYFKKLVFIINCNYVIFAQANFLLILAFPSDIRDLKCICCKFKEVYYSITLLKGWKDVSQWIHEEKHILVVVGDPRRFQQVPERTGHGHNRQRQKDQTFQACRRSGKCHSGSCLKYFNGPTPASICLFLFFSATIFQNNCRLQ